MKVENGVMYNVCQEDLNEDGSFIVPNSVTSIGEWAFYNCPPLTSVTIPDGVMSIGNAAFSGCSGLTEITIPNGVMSIGHSAFRYCSGLTSVTIGNGVTSIGNYAFRECYGLASVTIGNSVTSIGEYAFYGCDGLTSVTVPASVKSIGWGVFWGCPNLTSVRENYKAFAVTERGRLLCRNKIYIIGEKSTVEGELKICKNGIHYCTNIFDIFNYYSGEYGEDFVIGLCEVSDENIGGSIDYYKRCARWVKPTRILSREEVIRIMNGEE